MHAVRWAMAAWLLLMVAAILRLAGLEHNPPGLWQDEASTGLDAYLLWTTGRDAAGAWLPLAARSFGDYPLALYRYLAAPWVGLFGPSPGMERMVAALAGCSLVATAAAWVRQRRPLRDSAVPSAVAVLFTVGFGPLALFFSRYGSEAILMPAFLMAAVAWTEDERLPRWKLLAAAASLAASAYTYHAVKAFLPLWLPLFLWFRWERLKRLRRERPKDLWAAALVFAGLVLPSVRFALGSAGMARPNDVVAWAHHPWQALPFVIANHTLSYFDPGYLFVRGGPHLGQSVPGLGLFHGFELPAMVAGLRVLWQKDRRAFGFWLAWFCIGPVPGGLTYETQNVGRAIGWLPTVGVLSGLGLAWAFQASARWRGRWLLRTGLTAMLCLTVFATLRAFFWVYPRTASLAFQQPISATLQCARRLRTTEQILVSPRFHYAGTFGRFYFEPLQQTEGPDALRFEDPVTLRPGQLYAAPASVPRPAQAAAVCAPRGPDGAPQGWVYAHEPASAGG